MATAVLGSIPQSSGIGIEPLLTLEEVARILGRSHWSLREDNKAGRIRCVRIGCKLMVEPREVRRVIEEGLQTISA